MCSCFFGRYSDLHSFLGGAPATPYPVLRLLQRDQWKVNMTKCAFAQTTIAYLGHIISAEGMATDPVKVQVVQQWPVPVNARELRGFLGLARFYIKFVKHFSLISRPLTDLLKKHTLFVWTPTHQHAFDTLKQALSRLRYWHYLIFISHFAFTLMLAKQALEQSLCRMDIHLHFY